MTADTRALLAKARTAREEREALTAAIDFLWPVEGWPQKPYRDRSASVAFDVLAGPRAGRIGVPILAMPEGSTPFSVQWQEGGTATVLTGKNSKLPGRDTLKRYDAPLASCALMLAVLSAIDASKGE